MKFGDSISEIELSPHKYIVHADRFKTLAQGGDVFPVTVELDLVDYCDHNCGWCVDPRHGNNKQDIDFVMKLLNELRMLGVMGIVYKGGGEPTLHEAFPELLRITRSLGFEVGIVTNGSKLKDIHESIVLHASYLRVSIDGPTEDSHFAVHKSHDFEEIVKGVEKVVTKRKEAKQRHPIIGLSFAMDYEKIDLVDDAINLGDMLKVNYMLFRTPFFEEVGRKPTMTNEQASFVRKAFEESKQAYKGNVRVIIDYWFSDKEMLEHSSLGKESPRRGSYNNKGANGIEHITERCNASPLLAVVTADRKVYPCCNLRALEEWCIGKIDYSNSISFRNLWEAEQRHKVLERIHKVKCIHYCTHPMSKYNEVIEYLKCPGYHRGFV